MKVTDQPDFFAIQLAVIVLQRLSKSRKAKFATASVIHKHRRVGVKFVVVLTELRNLQNVIFFASGNHTNWVTALIARSEQRRSALDVQWRNRSDAGYFASVV